MARVRTILALLAGMLAFAAPAGAAGREESLRTSFLLSRAHDGGFPNGPSRNGTVSHDQRIARYMAFESDASNIVAGDSNGLTDVFYVARAQPWGRNGTEWSIGPSALASTGLGGAPANGRSYRPSLDGDSHHPPRCVAFISEASNLVRGDTNGAPDAFVRHIPTGRIQRVSVDSRGRQARGGTYEVSIDGACERVAFVSDAANLAHTRALRPGWGSARTGRPRGRTRQVYVRVLRGTRHDRGFRGLTFLASASDRGVAGNGNSGEVAFSRAGKALVFTSSATNLDGGDRGRTPDVYRRSFARRYRHLGHGRGVQSLRFATDLVSRRGGRAGNGPSLHPAITDDGRHVAYETHASDLLPGDSNGVSDIARATLGRRSVTQMWVSRAYTGIGDGPSRQPVISGAGEFVLFDSLATNLRPPGQYIRADANGERDVFLWNHRTRNVSLESRDSDNGYLSTPSQTPATSSRGNYVTFESANPVIDRPLVERLFPQLLERPGLLPPSLVPGLLEPDVLLPGLGAAIGAGSSGEGPSTAPPRASELAATAGEAVSLQQVYVRYLGPQ